MNQKFIVNRLRDALKEKEWTIKQLAELAGVAPTSLYRVTSLKRELSGNMLFAVCSTLEISADWLLGLEVDDTMAVNAKERYKFRNELADKLSRIIDGSRYTVKELSELTGVPDSSINAYKYGTAMPSSYAMAKICQVLDVDSNWLLGLEERV